MTEPPAPLPEAVSAARAHLSDTYSRGVGKLLWEMEKLPLPDLDAIRAVIAASSERLEALDVGAALVLLQAARLDLDRLELEVFDTAGAAGMGGEAIAAVLDLPDAEAAQKRRRWLESRRSLPHAEVESVDAGAAEDVAVPSGRRTHRGADRAAEVVRRRSQLSRAGRGRSASAQPAAKGAAAAEESRILADEAGERVALRLRRAAKAHERTAAAYEELAKTDRRNARDLKRKASEYHKAAAAYRRLAEHYRSGGGAQD